MPSFALHPINRITRSISSPNALASQNQTRLVSAVNPSRSHKLTSHHHPSPSCSPDSSFPISPSSHSDHNTMHRLNPVNFISSVTASNKPSSPVSSSTLLSARDSLPTPSSFSHHHAHKRLTNDQSLHPPTDLPPVSPMSSMYDPNSPEVSADGSGVSDDDSGPSASLSSSSTSDSLDGNLFLRPRSTHENRLHPTELRSPVTKPYSASRVRSQDIGPPVAFRRALFERPSSPGPGSSPARMPSQSRERLIAGIAARGKVVDEFVANRQVPDLTKSEETSHPVQAMPRVISGKSLEIPRGRVEQLPVPRPVTPCHIPRPETPSRLPRPRVFITQSPSRHSVVDPVAVTRDSEMGHGEAEFVTREVPRPTTPAPRLPHDSVEPFISSTQRPSLKEDFYFSDEEHVEDDAAEYQLDEYTPGAPTPSDMFSYKVRRAVSALRSISFQSHNPNDIETAWGQATTANPVPEKNSTPAAPSRWRRACGRISSKNGVQEYECQSEADARSINSYNSNYSAYRGRGRTSRDPMRGVIGVPLRGDHGSRQRKSLWTGGKRDRQQSPQTRAAELLLSNGQGLLAASTETCDTRNALTAAPSFEHTDLFGRAHSDARRGSVDKYVEFIHASAERDGRDRIQYRTLRSRLANRMFRRRWN